MSSGAPLARAPCAFALRICSLVPSSWRARSDASSRARRFSRRSRVPASPRTARAGPPPRPPLPPALPPTWPAVVAKSAAWRLASETARAGHTQRRRENSEHRGQNKGRERRTGSECAEEGAEGVEFVARPFQVQPAWVQRLRGRAPPRSRPMARARTATRAGLTNSDGTCMPQCTRGDSGSSACAETQFGRRADAKGATRG